jgi:pyruvate/2-oxoglutarate dehydrogenase complex dihydrolipoamide acyltransferase (E2) component
MSSTNNHQHSSPSVHRRGRRHSVDTEQQQQQQQFGTICRDAVRNALPSIGQHSATAPTVQVRNQFQQLQLQSDAPRASSTQPITRADHAALMMNRCENEASAEDDLI